jgi:hypothetical protein
MPELTHDGQTAGRTLQGLATDQFFYFFLRLRKSEIRRTGRFEPDIPTKLPNSCRAG